MTTAAPAHAPVYPAYCFASSPTFNKWVKLTAADVHGLRALPTFEDQGIYFHLNHPIRFVYICGPIVGIRPIPDDSSSVPYFVILDIDDSSGRTIEVKIRTVKPASQQRKTSARAKSSTLLEDTQNGDASSLSSAEDGPKETRSKALSTLKSFAVGTNVDNIQITNICSVKDCREKHVLLNSQLLELQTVIKAKGTIASYGDSRQIELERAFIVHTTDEELRIWEEYTAFCTDVLSRPWHLDKTELRKKERKDRERVAKAAAETKKREEKERSKEQMREKRREKHRAREVEEERKRQMEKADFDGNALDRPRWRPWPVVAWKMQRTKNG